MTNHKKIEMNAGGTSEAKAATVTLHGDAVCYKELIEIIETIKGRPNMTKEDFIANMQVQTLSNQIIDCENDITAMVEGLRVKRDELYALKIRIHAIENPGKPFIDTDLF